MRILFLTQVLPYPLDAGPKVRAYYTLRHLAQNHEVHLLSFGREGDPPAAETHLRSLCASVDTIPLRRGRLRDVWHLGRSILADLPFLIVRDWVPEMARAIAARIGPSDAASGFDVVHADQLWMAPYALLARRVATSYQPLLVLDQHNAVFQIPLRLAQHEPSRLKSTLLAREARALARYEAAICRRFDRLVWVTAEDQAAVWTAERRPPVRPAGPLQQAVIPICVAPGDEPIFPRRPGLRRVTFLGGLHWPPNAAGVRWFAREVWPLVHDQVGDAVFTVIGRDPPIDLVAPNVSPSSVESTGYVADPRPFLAETAAFVVPLQAGGGMRVKILDAWCWGLPVVTTTIGAEGILIRPGQNALLADSAADLAQAIVRLLSEPELSQQLARAGRQTVEQRYDWRRTYAEWGPVYERPAPGPAAIAP